MWIVDPMSHKAIFSILDLLCLNFCIDVYNTVIIHYTALYKNCILGFFVISDIKKIKLKVRLRKHLYDNTKIYLTTSDILPRS